MECNNTILNQNYKRKNVKRVMVRDGTCGQAPREKMAVAVSNSFYVVFYPILAPIPNFIKIGRKHN